MSALPDFDKLLQSMLKAIERKPIIPIEHQLWDEEDIANYFKYSLDYTKKNIIVNPKFPPSRPLPTSRDGERTVSRWKAMDVIKYAMAFDKQTLEYKG
jgi:hypothetical protein